MFERFHNVHSWSALAVMQEIQIGDVDKRLATFLQELVTSYGDVYQAIDVVDNQNLIMASSQPKNIGLKEKHLSHWFKVSIADKTLAAVSYTHLDVYKRQGSWWAQRSQACF